MKSKILITIAAVVIIAVVLSATIYVSSNPGSTVNPNTSPTPGASNPGASSTPTASSITTPYSVTDDEGYTTQFTAVPQKIVSLAPSNTQILYAIGAGDKVVGVTDYDNYPYNFSAWIAAGNMTSIGGFSTPNKETIASLNPDLILATNVNAADVVTLRGLGYKVLTLNPKSVDSVLNDLMMVGQATGNTEGASAQIDAIHHTINEIQAKIAAANLPKPRVYYEVWYPPVMTAGSTSFITDVITHAGGINVFGNETDQYPTVSSESVVHANPDVILLPTDMGVSGSAPFYGSVDQVKARSGWDTINAVQNNRVVIVDGSLFAEAGPRIAEQINAAAHALYPELFNST